MKLPEYKRLVEDGIEILAMDLCLVFLLAIGEQIDFNVRITTAGDVFDGEVPRFQNFHHQAFHLEIVA